MKQGYISHGSYDEKEKDEGRHVRAQTDLRSRVTMTRTFKHPLVAFREANGNLSQTEAAALVGITQAHWSRLETGEAHARPRIAQKIARLTGVAMESLLDLSDKDPVDRDGAQVE